MKLFIWQNDLSTWGCSWSFLYSKLNMFLSYSEYRSYATKQEGWLDITSNSFNAHNTNLEIPATLCSSTHSHVTNTPCYNYLNILTGSHNQRPFSGWSKWNTKSDWCSSTHRINRKVWLKLDFLETDGLFNGTFWICFFKLLVDLPQQLSWNSSYSLWAIS